jgi:uncharacterized membrane protein YebE (DUF533 family)
MTDWRKLATAALLADGTIDDREVKVLRKELYADGVIDKKEVEFLIELRNKAKSVSPAFKRFFFRAIKDNVLKDGAIDAAEARWLRKMLFADKVIDPDEKKFLRELKREAKGVSTAFQALYDECLG